MRRLLPLLLVSLVVGCGGDDGDSETTGEQAGSAIGAIPADVPVVFEVSADLESDEWRSAIAFAEALDPSGRDLAEALKADLFDGEVAYADVEPFLGDDLAFGLSGVVDEEPEGVIAIEIDDEEQARATLEDAAAEGERDATYDGVDYAVEEDGAAAGIVDGVLLGASDEESFKAAVDASRGDSIADAQAYQQAIEQAPDERLMSAYAETDGLLNLIADSGAVGPDVLEAIEQAPGLEPGAGVVASLVAEEDAMTLDLSAPGEAADGQSVADLPGGAWFALALGGEQLGQGILQGLAQSGGSEATQIADQLGLTAFLEGLDAVTLRVGGTAIAELNGQAELQGSDAGAAQDVVQGAAGQLRTLGAPVQLEGDRATITAPPLELGFEADGGTLRVSVGEQPDSDLADDEAFGDAADRLDLDRPVLFVDFAPLEQLMGSVPSDPDIEEAIAVLAELGYVIAGAGEDDGTVHSRVVLTLR